MKRQLLALALMTAGFASCTDDSYDLDNISKDFRIGLNEYLPIASSEVKLKDILSEFKTDYISEATDGVLTFKFDTVNRVAVKPIEVSFKELTFEKQISEIENLTIVNNLINSSTPSFSVKVPLDLSLDDENGKGRIDMIHVKNGQLRFRFEGDGFDASSLVVSTANIPFKGMIFNTKEDVQGFDLSDQIIEFSKIDGVEITLSVAEGKEIKFTKKDPTLKVIVEESTLSYHRIYGSFKSNKEQIEYTDFYINLYDDHLPDFKLNVMDSKLKITGVTNCGIPLECSVKSLVGKHKTAKASRKDSIVSIFMKGTPLESKSFDFQKFVFSEKENEEVVAFSADFDQKNGSLDSLFNYLPDSMSVKCGIKINADPESGVKYFLLDSTYLDLNIQAEVPLHIGNSSYITIRDTVDGIDIVKDITDYQEGSFKFDDVEIFIEFDNALPLEGNVTAKFCSADSVNGKVVLTHIDNKKLDQTVNIPAAKVDEGGYLYKSTPSTKKIVVSDDMVEDVKKVNAVIFTYKIKVPKESVDGVFLTSSCGMSAKVYSHLKANISNKEK